MTQAPNMISLNRLFKQNKFQNLPSFNQTSHDLGIEPTTNADRMGM